MLKATEPQQVVARGLLVSEMPTAFKKSLSKVLQNWIRRRNNDVVSVKEFDQNELFRQDKVGQKDESVSVHAKLGHRTRIPGS